MTAKFSAQPFSSQLRLLCKVLDDKDYEKIADYLLIFPMVNDPAVKFTEIYKNSHTIKTSNLLDHVIEFIHEKARPSVFLSYLRILSFVEGFEDDLIASDVCPVIADLIEDHPNDEKIQIDILKFLANLCCDSEARHEIGDGEHNIIELVRKKMECKAYQFSREYQRAALVFLTNLTEDNVENKENVSIDCVEVIMGALNMLDYPDITLPALFLVKNITTNIHADYITDINDHGCVDNVVKSIARYPNHTKIVATAFACLPNLVAKRAKTKRVIKEHQINIVLTSMHGLTNRNILRDAFTFLLLISKIATVRHMLGVNSVCITMDKLREHIDFPPLVALMISYLERILITESNIAGLDPEEDIPFLLELLSKYPKDRSIHLHVNKILRLLVDYKEVPGIIYGIADDYSLLRCLQIGNGGITKLIHSMNTFQAPIKTFASQTIELSSPSNEGENSEKTSVKKALPTYTNPTENLEDSHKLYVKIIEERTKRQLLTRKSGNL